ncbi:unnamed protein product [Macrosiphum euphorbiae]|uniref:Secreted protein n=1 Tax=Macrosiphum euphorbiae TaxID=13131 RepID=A0AAV0XN61_9HEMI|nr:unnamed protein product [Macrosiphum euphorbiae]CAI6369556.1 unnamed protein product [Macrosiphum euphorbiae]
MTGRRWVFYSCAAGPRSAVDSFAEFSGCGELPLLCCFPLVSRNPSSAVVGVGWGRCLPSWSVDCRCFGLFSFPSVSSVRSSSLLGAWKTGRRFLEAF